MRKLYSILAALVMSLGLMVALPSAANAHVTTCIPISYRPFKVGSLPGVMAKGEWRCTVGSHHEFVTSKMIIQYKVVRRFQRDAWFGIPPANTITSYRLNGTNYGTIRGANGTKWYRSYHELNMYGNQGVRLKNVKSFEVELTM